MSEIDELIVESAVTLEAKTASEIDSGELYIESNITKELKVRIPVEVEYI